MYRAEFSYWSVHQFTEPSLDQIQPTGTGRHEMADKAVMAFQPCF
jgi:hypothetical protein